MLLALETHLRGKAINNNSDLKKKTGLNHFQIKVIAIFYFITHTLVSLQIL